MSFRSLQDQQQQTSQAEEPEITNKEEHKAFNEEDLLREWMGMCNRMMQSMPGLAARMKNITPHITTYPNIELVVDNRQLLDQIAQIRGRIRKTMAIYLHNGNIDFTIRLAEAEEVKPIMTKRELFDSMRKENEAVELLRALFDLEMA